MHFNRHTHAQTHNITVCTKVVMLDTNSNNSNNFTFEAKNIKVSDGFSLLVVADGATRLYRSQKKLSLSLGASRDIRGWSGESQ